MNIKSIRLNVIFLITNNILQKAYEHVVLRRKNYSSNADIWDLRMNWKLEKERIKYKILNGNYRFNVVKEINIDNEIIQLWSAADAIVIKALELVLSKELLTKLSLNCYNIQGRGGMKAALQKVELNKQKNKYVLKSDVKKYYASIDHEILLNQIRKIIPESRIVGLIYQFLKHVRYRDGYYMDVKKGISRGTSLSPLLGALYLSSLDSTIEKMNVTYVRFVDDWVVMSDNRWTFARAIKKVNRILNSLKLEKAKDKTFIGKIDRGFDFLGFYFGKEGRRIARKTVLKFAERIAVRLYKAGYIRNESKGGYPVPGCVSLYVKRWIKWVKSIDGGHKTQLFETKTSRAACW